MSVIFIQENAAFNQVLTYQDWHNQLLNTINFILLLNFEESFFNYLKLGGKVADFSERSSRRFSSAVGAYWKHWLPFAFNHEAWKFFAHVYLNSKETVSQPTVSTGPNENVSFGAQNYKCLSKKCRTFCSDGVQVWQN